MREEHTRLTLSNRVCPDAKKGQVCSHAHISEVNMQDTDSHMDLETRRGQSRFLKLFIFACIVFTSFSIGMQWSRLAPPISAPIASEALGKELNVFRLRDLEHVAGPLVEEPQCEGMSGEFKHQSATHILKGHHLLRQCTRCVFGKRWTRPL